MELVDRKSYLWTNLSEETQGLIDTGETVLQFVYDYKDRSSITDYSFCVFSFAKAYEGFLKKLFLEMGFIKPHEYYGDEIRIGRILSPSFGHEKENIFFKICNHPKGGSDLSNTLWYAWKNSRNEVFHYFPHNFKKLDYDEAFKAITLIIDAMVFAAKRCAEVKAGLINLDEIAAINAQEYEKAQQTFKKSTKKHRKK